MGCRPRMKIFKKRWKLACLIICVTVFYNEHFSYVCDSLTWPRVSCLNVSNQTCKKILIVADPQILGSTNDLLGWITAKDSDRYVEKGFHHAFEHVKPDIVVFLGDLMDEGSTSTDEDYESYLKRFFLIFKIASLQSKVIFLPGDNDIGGESNDQVTLSKVERFKKYFPSNIEHFVGNIQFVVVNRILGDLDLPPVTQHNDKITVVLSHIPLTFIPGIFSDKVMKDLKPNAIFSAHDHRIAIATTRLNDSNFFEASHYYQESFSKIQKKLNAVDCTEVIWPTCSYRMGVDMTGYGFASISDGAMELGVLWVHSRFGSFTIYLLMGLLGLGIFFLPNFPFVRPSDLLKTRLIKY